MKTRDRDDDDASTRVSLTRGELLHLKSFAENVDPGCNEAAIDWWDHLTNKLERAVARIDGGEPRLTKTPREAWTPDLPRPGEHKGRILIHIEPSPGEPVSDPTTAERLESR